MDLAPLKATTARFGSDSYVVTFSGELDLHTAELAQQRLGAVLEQGPQRVIVDLVGVTFLGSAGLSVLTRAAKALRSNSGDLVVVSDDPRILRVFEITGLTRVFRIERSLLEAVEQLAAAAKVPS